MSEIKIEKIEHKNIYSALSAFQGEMKAIEKNGEVDFQTTKGDRVNFKYTTLDKEVDVINPLLAKNGLSFRHELGENSIECILMHETYNKKEIGKIEKRVQKKDEDEIEITYTPCFETLNEIRSGKLKIDLTKGDMKEVGGQITYGRRYTLGLVLGIASEEDKDTQLIDQAQKNASDFAFKTAKEAVEKATGEKLEEHNNFFKNELEKAKALEAGTGKVAPSLGLKATQYEELIKITEVMKKSKKVADKTTVEPTDE